MKVSNSIVQAFRPIARRHGSQMLSKIFPETIIKSKKAELFLRELAEVVTQCRVDREMTELYWLQTEKAVDVASVQIYRSKINKNAFGIQINSPTVSPYKFPLKGYDMVPPDKRPKPWHVENDYTIVYQTPGIFWDKSGVLNPFKRMSFESRMGRLIGTGSISLSVFDGYRQNFEEAFLYGREIENILHKMLLVLPEIAFHRPPNS